MNANQKMLDECSTLSAILLNMVEGGESDPDVIYADNYSAPDGDGYVKRAGYLLAGIATTLTANQTLTYPPEITPALNDVLSMMCFEFIGLARLFRDSGIEIGTSAEAEQAFFLHRLTKLVLLHGDDWRKVFAGELKPMIDAARAGKPKDGAQ